MKDTTRAILEAYSRRGPVMAGVRMQVGMAVERIAGSYAHGGKLLVCGNGGSCADADHIVGELAKGFVKRRPLDEGAREKYRSLGIGAGRLGERLQGALPAISLCAHASLLTAIVNDIGGEDIFAQQVVGYGRRGDVLLGISTSGNSDDVINAAYVAKVQGLYTIALSGRDGGRMGEVFDLSITVPQDATGDIQGSHSIIYHAMCEMLENEFFDE